MTLSIITITYNNFEELKETIESIPRDPNFQKVVINGGTCPKTLAFLKEHPEILSISEPDKGISDAFNKGIKKSSGDYLIFLNSGDCLISGRYLDWAIDVFESEAAVSFTHGDILFSDPTYGLLHLVPHQKSIGRGMPYYHQTMIVRKTVFDNLGGFNLDYSIAMDYEWVCRMEKAGYTGRYFSKEPVVRMDGGGVSKTHERKSIAEAHRALKQNQLLGKRPVFFDFSKRVLAFETRSALERLGLQRLVRTFKKDKRKKTPHSPQPG